jgi:hypothetical protein
MLPNLLSCQHSRLVPLREHLQRRVGIRTAATRQPRQAAKDSTSSCSTETIREMLF